MPGVWVVEVSREVSAVVVALAEVADAPVEDAPEVVA